MTKDRGSNFLGQQQSDSDPKLLQLRRQCRLSIISAIVLTVLGLTLALPIQLKRWKELKAANLELNDLQAAIVEKQTQIRAVQAKILTTQNRISSILNAPK